MQNAPTLNKSQPVTSASPVVAGRMSLDKLSIGRKQSAKKVLLYGTEGIGKSTFAAGAPKPIFLGAEDGTDHLDVTRFPPPEGWSDLLEAVRVLTNDEHEFRTLVLDTADWAEPMLWSFICKRDGEKSIESYGYGKGFTAALDEWRIFLAALERLRRQKDMNIILLAHAWVKAFKNPEGEDFDRYELKLNAKASGLLKEWCDAVLFAAFETFAVKDDKKRVRGVSSGARLIYTERRAAYDAKNRFGLPPSLPLSWTDFAAAVEAGQPADPAKLRAEIEVGAKKLGGDIEATATKLLGEYGDDAGRLVQLLNRVNAKLAEAEK